MPVPQGLVTPHSSGAPWAKPEHLFSIVPCTGEGQGLRHCWRMRAAPSELISTENIWGRHVQFRFVMGSSLAGPTPLGPCASIQQWIKAAQPPFSLLGWGFLSPAPPACAFNSKMTSVFLEALEKKSGLLASASPAPAIDSLEMFHIWPNWLLTE